MKIGFISPPAPGHFNPMNAKGLIPFRLFHCGKGI
jgi:hypothetical protein